MSKHLLHAALAALTEARVRQHHAHREMAAAKNDRDHAHRIGDRNGSTALNAAYVAAKHAFDAAHAATGQADDHAIALGATLAQRQTAALKARTA